MQVELFLEALRADLTAAASLGDEQTQAAAERVAAALQPAVKMRVLDLLGQVALDVSGQLPEARLEVRLVGADPELVVVAEPPTRAELRDEHDDSPGEADPEARISLRLPSRLKARIDAAADRDGVSTNTWISRALAAAVTSPRHPHDFGREAFHGRRRLRGYGQS
ncbi:MAG TPA: toxin-antitoxin system HicB family antitoxin [Mycobacteriales bacterium]|nr:toxin-antitoxin system HicB family antitoxin [Mycobacteriales bacterium]